MEEGNDSVGRLSFYDKMHSLLEKSSKINSALEYEMREFRGTILNLQKEIRSLKKSQQAVEEKRQEYRDDTYRLLKFILEKLYPEYDPNVFSLIHSNYFTTFNHNIFWNFSTRTSNRLPYDVKCLFDLTKYSQKDLEKIEGLGAESLKEIKEQLAEYNLKLKEHDDSRDYKSL